MRKHKYAAWMATLAAIVLLGCANNEQRMGRMQSGRLGSKADIPTNVKDAESPKVYPETYLAAGRLFESHGQFEKAIVQYRKAIAVNHSYVEAHHRLGLLWSLLSRREEAIDALSRAVQLAPDDAMLRNNLGFELLLAGRFPEAEVQLEKALTLQPVFARAHVNRALLESKLGRFDEALAHFQAALPAAEAYYNLGLMYRSHKRFDQAAASFAKALELNPKLAAANAQLRQLALHRSESIDREATALVDNPAIQVPRRTTESDAPSPSESSRDPWNDAFSKLDEVFNAPIASPQTMPRGPSTRGDDRELNSIAENELRCRGIEEAMVSNDPRFEVPADGVIESWSALRPVSIPARTASTSTPYSTAAVWNEQTMEWQADEAIFGVSLADGRAVPIYESPAEFAPARLADRGPVMFATVLASNVEGETVPGDGTVDSLSSLDSWALLRELETELSAVRNEIGCVEEEVRFDPVIDRRDPMDRDAGWDRRPTEPLRGPQLHPSDPIRP